MEGLRDIKDVVEVQEHSLAMLIALIATVLFFLGVALYLFKNRRRRRKKPTAKEIALQKLQNLDYSNPKEVVYTFEAEGELFVNEKNQEDFNKIKKELEIYKYKRDVPPLDEVAKKEIEQFIKGLR